MALSIKIRRTPNAELPMGTPRLLRNLDNYRVSWQRAKPLSLASEMLQLGGGVEDSRGATRGASVGMTQPACADLFRGSLSRTRNERGGSRSRGPPTTSKRIGRAGRRCWRSSAPRAAEYAPIRDRGSGLNSRQRGVRELIHRIGFGDGISSPACSSGDSGAAGACGSGGGPRIPAANGLTSPG
jgi:hypothetical protein